MAATATHRCSHCARLFGRAEHLRRHERTHTNEKPYICDLCPEAYSRRDLLKRHEIKAHDISRGVRQRRKSQNSSGSSPRSITHPRRGSRTTHVAVESPLEVTHETDWPQPQQHHLPDHAQQPSWDASMQPPFEHTAQWADGQWPQNEQCPPNFDVHPVGSHPDLDSGQWLNGLYDQNVAGAMGHHTDPSLTLDPALMDPSFNIDMAHGPDLNGSVAPAMDFHAFDPSAQVQPMSDGARVAQQYWHSIHGEASHLQASPLPQPEKPGQSTFGSQTHHQ